MISRMPVLVVALVMTAGSAARAQGRCAHASRDALIGAGVGAAILVGVTLSVPRSHEERPSDVTGTRALGEVWVGAWGAGLGSIAGSAMHHECFRKQPAHRDAGGRCGSAARTGAFRGGLSGAVLGFLISPVAVLPLLPHAGPAKQINLDHVMGLVMAGGTLVGASVGELEAARECRRS
jgi:hypothetical protein